MPERARSHWHEEVESLRAAPGALRPAASAAVCAVLESVLAEDALEPAAAETARSLLSKLVGLAERRSAVEPVRGSGEASSGPARRTSSRRLVLRRRRLVSAG
jgi:hypothetical protein